MCIADLVTAGEFAADALQDPVWGEWLRGAMPRADYLRAIAQAGFQDVRVDSEAVFPMAENDERLKGRITSIRLTARKPSGRKPTATELAEAKRIAALPKEAQRQHPTAHPADPAKLDPIPGAASPA